MSAEEMTFLESATLLRIQNAESLDTALEHLRSYARGCDEVRLAAANELLEVIAGFKTGETYPRILQAYRMLQTNTKEGILP